MRRTALTLAATLLVVAAACLSSPPGDGPRWVRGNTHTHTLWSDGNTAPELVVDWYRERGYQFLVLSDHNVLSRTERWMPVGPEARVTDERLRELTERFGAESLDLRETEEGREMRLLRLPELRERFERPGEFVLVEGEEITDSFADRPIHVNGVNLVELIEPQGGRSLQETLNNDVDAVAEQSRRLGVPMLAHLNHPNYGYAVTWEDLAHVRGDRFFEVYNGHPGVHNQGDDAHPSTEEMWDLANTLRLTELDLPLLFGLATDDAHDFSNRNVVSSQPGRGWVMVRTEALTADAVVGAMSRGEFYSSSGVTIDDAGVREGRYFVDVAAEPGVDYSVKFVGTLMAGGEPAAIGEVLSSTTDDPAEYAFRGDELFVRAVVVSSRLHPNPYREGDFEMAWLQPVEPPGSRR
jgi:hypothetical protein